MEYTTFLIEKRAFKKKLDFQNVGHEIENHRISGHRKKAHTGGNASLFL